MEIRVLVQSLPSLPLFRHFIAQVRGLTAEPWVVDRPKSTSVVEEADIVMKSSDVKAFTTTYEPSADTPERQQIGLLRLGGYRWIRDIKTILARIRRSVAPVPDSALRRPSAARFRPVLPRTKTNFV